MKNADDSLLDVRDPTVVGNRRGRPRVDAENRKPKVPRYLKIADEGPGSDDADDTDDDNAEAEPTVQMEARRGQRRGQGRGRGRRHQPCQTSGRGTRPLSPSLRRNLSQFEVEEPQVSSQPRRTATSRARVGRASRGRVPLAARARSSPTSSETEDCIVIPAT